MASVVVKKPKFSLTQYKAKYIELIKGTDQETLAIWAIDCAERVLPFFEEKYPEDHRPRKTTGNTVTCLN